MTKSKALPMVMQMAIYLGLSLELRVETLPKAAMDRDTPGVKTVESEDPRPRRRRSLRDRSFRLR